MRPNWYRNHPSACTCAECTRKRAWRRAQNENASRGRPKRTERDLQAQRADRGRSRRRGGPFKWLVVVAVVIVAVAWVEAYRKDVPFAVTAWEKVASPFENLRPQGLPPSETLMLAPTATPTATPTAVPTATPTPASTATPTPAPTATPTLPPTATATPVPTATPTSTPTTTPMGVPMAGPMAPRAPTSDPTATPTPDPAATPTSDPTATPNPTPTTPQNKHVGEGKLDRKEIESWVIKFTNEERKNAGLEPFQHDLAISDIARSHSEDMVETGVFGHSIDGKDPTDRALDAGYDCRAYRGDGSYSYGLSENIALRHRVNLWRGRGSRWWPEEYEVDSKAMARGLVEQWMNSPGHRQNILDRQARKVGVGVAVAEEGKYGYISETVYATELVSEVRDW